MTNLQLAYLKLRAKLSGVYLFQVPKAMVFTLAPEPYRINLLATYIQPLGDWETPAWFRVVGIDGDYFYLHAVPQCFTPPKHLVTNTFFDYSYLAEVGS